MNTCPCNPNKLFSDCCEPYLKNIKKAETPEILMRSRYSAYSLAEIDYIQKTMRKKAAKNFDALSAKKWAVSVTWLGLTVIEAPDPIKNHCTVTFIAYFSEDFVKKNIHEKSEFEKINGEWFYVDGSTPGNPT